MTEPPPLHLDSSYGDYIKLFDNVSESLKSKIWSNTYIDMAQLLANKKKTGYSLSCELDSEGNPGIVWTQQNTGFKLSIEQWTNAFNIFMAVYLEKEGNQIEAPALCKHGDIVRELASLQADWSMYDEQFRKNRARTGRNWANKHNELYCKALALGISNKSWHSQNTQNQKNKTTTSLNNTKQKKFRKQSFCSSRFQGDRVPGTSWAFNGVETAGGVTMTTSVAGVKEPIQQYSVQGIHKLPYPNLVPGSKTRNLNRTKQNLPTPINPIKLEYLLLASGYPQHQIDTLVKGFTEGFDIGYLGDRKNPII